MGPVQIWSDLNKTLTQEPVTPTGYSACLSRVWNSHGVAPVCACRSDVQFLTPSVHSGAQWELQRRDGAPPVGGPVYFPAPCVGRAGVGSQLSAFDTQSLFLCPHSVLYHMCFRANNSEPTCAHPRIQKLELLCFIFQFS